MSGALPLDVAILASLIPGCVLYGIFLVLFGTAVYILLHQRNTPRPNRFLLAISVIMFIDGTTSEALTISRVFDAFIVYRESAGTLQYLETGGQWQLVTRAALLGANFVAADFTLIYRVWTIWGGNRRVVVLPLCVFLANMAVGTGAVAVLAKGQNSMPTHDHDPEMAPWIISFMTLTLVQNITSTALIAWRIWTVHAATRRMAQTSLTPVISLIIETGSLYVAAEFALLVSYASRSNALYVVYDIVNQSIGIAFTMLIVRVGLGLTRGSPPASDPYPIRASQPPTSLTYKSEIEGETHIPERPTPAELQFTKQSDEVVPTV